MCTHYCNLDIEGGYTSFESANGYSINRIDFDYINIYSNKSMNQLAITPSLMECDIRYHYRTFCLYQVI